MPTFFGCFVSRPTFKRAKRIIALHYGSLTLSTRKLCMLFRQNVSTPKNEAIIAEAIRILQLRHNLGYDTSDAGIDQTMLRVSKAQTAKHSSGTSQPVKPCIICKEPLNIDGWQVAGSGLHACPGDCSVVASFYYLPNGTKLTTLVTFRSMYGKRIEDLSPAESFDALLAYQLHLSAHRQQRIQKNAKLSNPTHGNARSN